MIRERGHTNGDVALALLFYGGLAGGVLLTGLGGPERGAAAGVPLRLDHHDLGDRRAGSRWRWPRSSSWSASGLSPQLFAVAQDQEFARVAGLHVRAYNLLVAVLAAVSVTVAMRTVGLLLVSALMVVPVATAQQLTRSFRTTLAAAMVLGTLASVGGLVHRGVRVRSHARVAPGPTIVLLSLAGFVVTWPLGVVAAAPRSGCGRRSRPVGPTSTRSPPTSTRTSTARTAATSRSSTATTSTTSTTATGTPPTGEHYDEH